MKLPDSIRRVLLMLLGHNMGGRWILGLLGIRREEAGGPGGSGGPGGPDDGPPPSVTVGARAMKLELSNVVAVARREYLARARTRAFRLTTVFLVIAAIGLSLAPVLIRFIDQRSGPTTVEVYLGDSAPAIDAVAAVSAVLNNAGGSGTTGSAAYTVGTTSDLAAAKARVESGTSVGVLVMGRDATSHALTFTFITKAKAVDSISQFMKGIATLIAREDLLARAGVSPDVQQQLQVAPAYATQLPSGEPINDTAESMINQFAIGFILSIVLFMAIILYGQWVAYSVAEEKSSRVMEVILGAASPFELLAGKVVGVGGLALTQYAIIFLPAAAVVLLQDQIASLVLGTTASAAQLPPGLSLELLITFGVLFVLGFALYAVLYAGAAALVSRTEDINAIVAPMTLVSTAGYMVAVYSSTGLIPPDAAFVVVMSYIPFFSPYLVLARMGSGAMGPLEVVVAVAILAVSVPLALWFAARLYAAGVLMYGQRPSIKLMLRVLRGA
ncbi:MAG TPA: ABC transporter permease [Candidatus Acidoferrales bacterium]|nr:ABC transporter permease [Candidatus Acidoferrales bacterium]